MTTNKDGVDNMKDDEDVRTSLVRMRTIFLLRAGHEALIEDLKRKSEALSRQQREDMDKLIRRLGYEIRRGVLEKIE
jgi:hypothetical protein